MDNTSQSASQEILPADGDLSDAWQSNQTPATMKHQRGIRSFVKREGRLSPRVQKVWDEMSAEYIIPKDVFQKLEGNPDALLTTLFGDTRAKLPLVVEIGSGQGNQVVHSAKGNPEVNYLALEVYHTGAAHTLLLMRNNNVTNVRIAELDAKELLLSGALKGVISELWTFFPDPWPKRNHHKRRLVNDDFLKIVKENVSPGGVWRLATDWAHYAQQMRAVLKTTPGKRFDGRLLTNFEKKGIAAGREIFDFTVQM
ncbi:MAG: tRNA (guanosine(46)-N7)-methyltransferase TrmB [Candidatus Ancillula sp.]|jgi:tRNA (guanine-N7-)-methyltransferase|nr:tRNA (guanosine(46)-N7)-methyltransferase TrmB [Candidatus Ancillula sp.]